MAELVQRRYAGAYYEVAKELQKEDDFLKELQYIDAVLKDNPDFMKVLKAPMISKDEKKSLIEKVFADQLSISTFNFLKILIDKSRVATFPQISEEFRRLLNIDRNIKEVTAITASPLSAELKAELIEKLKAITGSEIILNDELDASIMGGVLIKIGNEQMDGTVKHRLEALKHEISAIIA